MTLVYPFGYYYVQFAVIVQLVSWTEALTCSSHCVLKAPFILRARHCISPKTTAEALASSTATEHQQQLQQHFPSSICILSHVLVHNCCLAGDIVCCVCRVCVCRIRKKLQTLLSLTFWYCCGCCSDVVAWCFRLCLLPLVICYVKSICESVTKSNTRFSNTVYCTCTAPIVQPACFITLFVSG